MSDETYYTVLGISETATELDIRAAYRNLLKKIHPDTVSTLSPDLKRLAEGATKDINEAYSVLSDASERRQYDRTLAERRRNAAPHPTTPDVPRGQQVRPQTSPSPSTHHRHRHHHHRNNGYFLRLRRWAFAHPTLASVLAGLLVFGLAIAILKMLSASASLHQ
jgi:curved DNA-binding protein CbpA